MQVTRPARIPPSDAGSRLAASPPLTKVAKSVPAPPAAPTDADSMMAYLKETYQNIDFDFLSLSGKEDIARYAAGQRGFNNVAIAPALLEKMCSDEKLRQRVESILQNLSAFRSNAQMSALLSRKELLGTGLVLDEKGKVSQWTAAQKKDTHSYQPENWRENPTNFYDTKAKPKKSYSNYHYSHSSRMRQLERAGSVSAVRGIIAAQQGEIQKAKLHLEPEEAAKVVGKIRAGIRKGQIKIARLHKEEDLEILRRIAEKKLKAKMEEQLREQLRKKRSARKGEERCQTADLDDVLASPAMTDERYKQLLAQYTGASLFETGSLSGSASYSIGTESAGTVCVDVSSVASVDVSV